MPFVFGRELIDDAAEGGEQVERIAQPLVVARRRLPGEGVVAGRVVVLHGVGQRADERDVVHPLGRFGQLLADLDIRAARGNRLERAAIVVRRIRLHVEHIDVARPAPLEQKHHRLRLDRGSVGLMALGGFEEPGDGEPQHPEPAHRNGPPPAQRIP
jgi:hypothetical protein